MDGVTGPGVDRFLAEADILFLHIQNAVVIVHLPEDMIDPFRHIAFDPGDASDAVKEPVIGRQVLRSGDASIGPLYDLRIPA